MSGALGYTYPDPYRVPAGVLTLAVHVLFFVLLYLGVNWQAQPLQGMAVDLWSDLPAPEYAPPQSMPPAAQPEPPKAEAAKPPQPVQPVAKAEIELPKKKKEAQPKKEAKPQTRKKTAAELRKEKAEMQELLGAAERSEEQARAQQAAGLAAISSEMGKYKGLIGAKIRSNIVMPPDVADEAQAVFEVTLLPDGSVLEAQLRKSSGNAAYDSAVDRAIRKAQPLPLPQGEALRKAFINPNRLTLKFSPKD